MTQNNTKKSSRNRMFAAAFLGMVGLFSLLGAASTEDFREEVKTANNIAGKEVYSEKDIASSRKTAALGLFGIACTGAAMLLGARKQR